MKPDAIEITIMLRFVGQGVLNATCITHQISLVSGPSNSPPPNMTPVFNEIGPNAGRVFLQNASSELEITYIML